MHFPFLKLGLFVLGAALCSLLTMFFNFKAARDSWSDGKPALAAEFLGFWAAFAVFFWSFTVESQILRWSLWAGAAVVAIVGLVVSTYFGMKPEAAASSGRGDKTNGLLP